jgi:HAD domain in Swiss Army Knife RNA repair proteins
MATQRARIVLFLDIDGVLAPFPMPFVVAKGRIFPDHTIAALSSILDAFAEDPTVKVEIVLSSTWRVQQSFRNDILNEFRAYGRGPLATLADFYDITDPAMHSERQLEIYSWQMDVEQSNDPERKIAAWVCLDDEDLIHGASNAAHKSHFEGHVIHCDSRVGLTQDQAKDAIQLIRQQLSRR